MTHQSERRKTWWLGLPPSSWITITIFLCTTFVGATSIVVSFAEGANQINTNKEAINKNKREVASQVKDIEKKLSIKIDSSEGRMRADLKEIRNGIQQILLNNQK